MVNNRGDKTGQFGLPYPLHAKNGSGRTALAANGG